jgi:hypothetical protein
MRRVGVRDALIPTHSRNPCCGLVEGTLRRGQCGLMAIHIELATDGAREHFFHKKV